MCEIFLMTIVCLAFIENLKKCTNSPLCLLFKNAIMNYWNLVVHLSIIVYIETAWGIKKKKCKGEEPQGTGTSQNKKLPRQNIT